MYKTTMVRTALIEAAREGHDKCVDGLIRSGADGEHTRQWWLHGFDGSWLDGL